MANLEIIAHRGLWAENSQEWSGKAFKAKQHSSSAILEAIAEGFGQEVDLRAGLMNGSSLLAITSAYPFDRNFELPYGTMRLVELLELRQSAKDGNFNPGTLLIDIKDGRDREILSSLLEHIGENQHLIFNVESPSDWKHFAKTPYLQDRLLRMHSDENPFPYNGEYQPVFQQSAGLFLDLFDLDNADNVHYVMTMAARAVAKGKTVVLVSPEVCAEGAIDPHEHQEDAQPYRRQWQQMGQELGNLVKQYQAADIKILTDFPRAARDHFMPQIG